MRLGAIIAGAIAVGGAIVAGIFGKRVYEDSVSREVVEGIMAGSGVIKLRLTGYWPFTAKSGEQKMEGGVFDRKMPEKYKNQPDSPEYKAHLLRTVEDFFAGKSDFVSLSGDDAAWPYGQKVIFPWVDGRQVVGRVVDTGSHFRGSGKVYRDEGYEPIDVCVASSSTQVPKEVMAQIVVGDHLDKPDKMIATNLFKGQDVTVGLTNRELNDPQWRAWAADFGAAHGDTGEWVRSQYGLWSWRRENGKLDSMPLSLMRTMYPGMTPLIDLTVDENESGPLDFFGIEEV